MARQIDPRNTLDKSDEEVRKLLQEADDEDRRYLLQRPWTLEEYRRRGFGGEVDALTGSVKQAEPVENPADVTTEQLRQGAQPPGPGAQPNGDQVNDPDDDYEEWTVGDLKEEIEARNADGRDDGSKLAVSGKKEELIARLREDDAATGDNV
jgi:hypothetical protein